MITKPPGVEDIFPHNMTLRNRVTDTARQVFKQYNIKEIITPVMEYTEVFSRGLGNETDIVSKEMFSLEDRGGRDLTLRPEGTASVVRAYVENGEYNRLALTKFFYMGPMFRAERPQKGRLRQFTQFGVEIFGSSSSITDFETMAVMDTITKKLGITDYNLVINSIGCPDCRPAYLEKLTTYYADKQSSLCSDCQKRSEKNILRLLDCKNESCQNLRVNAPVITENLCEPCSEHHGELKNLLAGADIGFTEDPFLVRGLDYYTRTTFEFITTALGSQNAFAAGGRYDGLVEQFGGKPKPAVGFAAGIERLILMLSETETTPEPLDIWVMTTGDVTPSEALPLITRIRAMGYAADMDPSGGSFKNQLKKADREKAIMAFVLGDEEKANNRVTIKHLHQKTETKVAINALEDFLLKNKP